MDINNVLVSVIVPVYNGELYIEKCIDSILKQTYKEIEVIIVNDGSVDSTLDICMKYSTEYNNIQLINKKNNGVVAARLDGIKMARGKYISFVDADDWIEEEYIGHMINEMGDSDIILAGINHVLINEDNRNYKETNSFKAGIYEKRSELYEIYRRMLCYKPPFKMGILPYACNKIYKKEVLLPLMEHVDKEINDGEDVAVILPYLINSKKICISEYCGYNYLIHSDSACHQKKEDAYYNAGCLYIWLYKCFIKHECKNELLEQLQYYYLRMIWKRNPSVYLEVNDFVFPFKKIKPNSKVIIYGAGDMGQAYYRQLKQTNYCQLVAWVDRKLDLDKKSGFKLIKPNDIMSYEYDYVVIAISSGYMCSKVEEYLVNNGIDKNIIIY